MMHNRGSAVIDRHDEETGIPPARDRMDFRLGHRFEPMRRDTSTLQTAGIAVAAATLLVLSPEIGIGAAVAGALIGGAAAVLALTRKRIRQ